MSMSRGIGVVTVVLSVAALGAGGAGAEELWAVRSGQVTFHFNAPLLRDLGLELTEVKSSASPPVELLMEEPNWTFAIREVSDLKFRTEHGIVLPNGLAGGNIRLNGAITVHERTTGRESRLEALEIANVVSAEQGESTRPLCLRSAGRSSRAGSSGWARCGRRPSCSSPPPRPGFPTSPTSRLAFSM